MILKIALFAVVAVVAIVVTKQLNPEFATVLTVCSGVALTILICDQLFEVVYTFYNFAESSGIDSEAISCVVKVVGIGYVAEFANNICADANCKSVGDKVLLASKISILFCAMPVVSKLFALIRGIVL
ncbi:MAG: stage III sporulation AC/AD family protein [Corallococcus sp.]|nr:stage III sporulation AC/AD family protein [Corallococcus sp.]MCM1359713.1 stage III sporulation AC/AD family protein [Corallococcus sp.]MCM1395422.1 stage III sporulation AC/AD family protein [Corallococcus sp.]